MLKKKCEICKKVFYVKPFFVRSGWGIYCSRKCHYNDKTGRYFDCFICEKKVYRTNRQVEHSKSGKYFCGKSCQTKWRNTQFIGKAHANWKHGKSEYATILQRHNIPKTCTKCGEKDSRVIATHHVDWNHQNNKIENLIWLCHNCHHLAHYANVKKQNGGRSSTG